MYQRNVASKPAGMNDNVGMGTVRFLDRCSEELKLSGKEEASFFFEQLVTHLRSGGSFNENQDVNQVLGL